MTYFSKSFTVSDFNGPCLESDNKIQADILTVTQNQQQFKKTTKLTVQQPSFTCTFIWIESKAKVKIYGTM